MKTHPILFSTDMVMALLHRNKIQTRRIVKNTDNFGCFTGDCNHWIQTECFDAIQTYALENCPHGQPGDLLWVRETWKYWNWTEDGMPWIKYAANDEILFFDSTIPEEWCERLTNIWASLSEPENYEIDQAARDHKWRPNIFLPRWASRLTLKITDIRIERVQDISNEDAVAEGIGVPLDMRYAAYDEFRPLWDRLNAKRGYGWDENPWVWVIQFDVIHKNIDHALKEAA